LTRSPFALAEIFGKVFSVAGSPNGNDNDRVIAANQPQGIGQLLGVEASHLMWMWWRCESTLVLPDSSKFN